MTATRVGLPSADLRVPGERAAYIALLAVGMAVFSRVLVSFGAPGALNFVHFPLAILAFAWLETSKNDLSAKSLAPFWFFLGVTAFSGLINTVEPLRVLLTWLVWVEPILIAYVVWTVVSREAKGVSDRIRMLAWWVLGISIGAQYLFMTLQIPRRTFGPDEMQGTFLGSGTGAHVAPALALLGAVLLIDSANRRSDRRLLKYLLASFGFVLALLGAARAVLATVLIALFAAIVIVYLTGKSRRSLAPLLMVLLVGFATLTFARPLLGTIPPPERLTTGIHVKLIGVERLSQAMIRDPTVAMFGKGPGTTLSRVALETPEASLSPNSAIAVLGFETTPFTAEVSQLAGAQPIGRSSLFSPWGSLIGVSGDLGVVGLVAYVMLWVPLIRSALLQSREKRYSVLAIIVMSLLLGVQQIYLEDPGFILPVALILALLAAQRPRNRDVLTYGTQ